MKETSIYTENDIANSNSFRDLFVNKLESIKELFNNRLINKKFRAKENVKKQYSELKKYEEDLLKYEDELKDMDYCLINSKDLTSAINCKKNRLLQRFETYNNVKFSNNAINSLMFMDKESIRKVEKTIDKLDKNEISFEKTYKINEFNIKKICNLHMIYDGNKFEIKDIQPLSEEVSDTINEITKKYEEYHLQDKEIRDKFNQALNDAKYELNIASPWMNNYVVNDEMIRKMERLLIRGASIKIIYGIVENSYNLNKDNKSFNSDRIAQKLIDKFYVYGDQFKIKKVNSHNKLLICDDSFYIETSFNLLSFAGEYDENSKDTRGEGATFSTNREVIKDLRYRYFDF